MRKTIVFTHDILVAPLMWIVSYWVRFNLETIPEWAIEKILQTIPYVILSQFISIAISDTHNSIWRFSSISDITKIVKTSFISITLLLSSLFITGNIVGIPRLIFPCFSILLICGMSFPRILRRLQKEHIHSKAIKNNIPAIIVGAGNAGSTLLRNLENDKMCIFKIIGFIDDSSTLQKRQINNTKVLGKINDIKEIVLKHNIKHIIIAVPSATNKELKRIFEQCRGTAASVSKLPNINDLVSGKLTASSLEKVSFSDLLFRDEFSENDHALNELFHEKIILITGAGGSIGSEVCRQVCKLNPKKIIAIDNTEYNLFKIEQELLKHQLLCLPILADIRDKGFINKIFSKHMPNFVFHAAAYKHVPLLQEQIRAAAYNNILGTKNVADAAIKYKADKFILVSTDKAVEPNNNMGKTKRVSELICQNYNNISATSFITVRFGNVLGSAGSVIPTFKKQIENGGPITVTHPEMSRFFMTIPEASRLIIKSSHIGKGGEIFVLDMGEPIKITDLAKQVILLSGHSLDDIPIKFTGLRPGEKLHETLFYGNESLRKTKYKKIRIASGNNSINQYDLSEILNSLHDACTNFDDGRIENIILEIISLAQKDEDKEIMKK